MFFFAAFAFAAALAFRAYARRYKMTDNYRSDPAPTASDIAAGRAGAATLPEARDVSDDKR
jgi:hypothetical protein